MPDPLLLVCALVLAAPQDMRGEMEIPAATLGLSPSGDLWIGAYGGRLFVSRDGNKSWSEVDVGARAPHEGKLSQETIGSISFFDAERGIAAGYLGAEAKNEILRTTDGGRTWGHVALGVPHGLPVRVSGVQARADGFAWMVASTGVLVSRDFGATWHSVATPPSVTCACFRTPELAVVGAAGNHLNRTTDGGRTWTWIPTPIDELYPAAARDPEAPDPPLGDWLDFELWQLEQSKAEDERRVSGLWYLGEHVLAHQYGRLFERPFEGEGKWKEIDLGGRKVASVVVDRGRLFLVTDDQRANWVSSALELTPACPEPLECGGHAFAIGEGGVAFLDSSGWVYTLTDGVLAGSPLYPGDGGATWPIAALDRTSDGTLFGVSNTSLYRSRDSGQSWERLAVGRYLRDVHLSADGEQALVHARGSQWLWREGVGRAPATLDERTRLDTRLLRDGDLWIVAASEAAEDARTRMMLMTRDIVFTGPGFRSVLFSSIDEGRSWKRIAEQQGAIVLAAWLGDEGFLRLCLSDGTIRGGTIDARDGTLVGGELALVSQEENSSGGEGGTWLAFPDAQTGWVGWNHCLGSANLARTSDGGRTWTGIESASEDWTEAFRLGGGVCVRVVRSEPHRVELWRDGEFREIRRFETEVHDARVDAGGRLLVRLENGEVWSLSADGADWSEVGKIPVPPR